MKTLDYIIKIRLYYNDLPIKQVFKIHSITVVIKSLIEKNNKFYLELSINHCLYKLENNDLDKN